MAKYLLECYLCKKSDLKLILYMIQKKYHKLVYNLKRHERATVLTIGTKTGTEERDIDIFIIKTFNHRKLVTSKNDRKYTSYSAAYIMLSP